MECRYCCAVNGEESHRCRRCGRWFEEARQGGSPAIAYQSGAAAPAWAYAYEEQKYEAEREAEQVPVDPVQVGTPSSLQYQRSLFPSRDSRVVETFSPATAPKRSEQTRRASRPRVRKPVAGQQALDFSEPIISTTAAPVLHKLGVRDCDEPVALAPLRVVAVAFDFSLVAIAFALFASVFHFAGGVIPFTKGTAIASVGIAAALLLFYKLLWCLAGADTAGTRWAHLRLISFHGLPPTTEQRLWRLATGTLSFLAAGLGMLWALVDEEALTWHDHISKTYPTLD